MTQPDWLCQAQLDEGRHVGLMSAMVRRRALAAAARSPTRSLEPADVMEHTGMGCSIVRGDGIA